MICNRCGKCCNTVILALHHVPIAKDTQELNKWLLCHGYETTKIFNGKEDVLALKLDKKCSFLNKDNNCKIYDSRPQICKDFWCKELNLQEIMDKTAKELVGDK